MSGDRHDASMDRLRVGRALRALRRRRGLRQRDVAAAAGVSQAFISDLERGRTGRMQGDRVERVAAALDAELVVFVRWRGGDLDRLLDEAHATLVGIVAGDLESLGWQVVAEVTYSVYGERGSIDLLAWHAATSVLLVIEVKSELTSIEETLRRHDAKVRLAAGIVRERFGWAPTTVARLLALPADSTSRRRVARHDAVLRRSYPLRGRPARAWLRRPETTAAGILTFSAGASPSRHAVRG